MWADEAKLGKFLVRPEYLDVAGDLVAGFLLSQIVYWFRPKQGGKVSVNVSRDGRLWIAKTQEQWCKELRIGLWQFQQALKKLMSLGVVTTRTWKYGNRPVLHIGLNLDVLMGLVHSGPKNGDHQEHSEGCGSAVEPTIGKPDNQGLLCGNPMVHCVETSDSYLEEKSTKKIASAQAQQPGQIQQQPIGDEMPTLKEIMDAKNKAVHLPPVIWKNAMSTAYGGFQKPLTVKEASQLKALNKQLVAEGLDLFGFVNYAIQNWSTCCSVVRVKEGLTTTPERPVIGWCLQHWHHIANEMKTPEPVQSIAVVAPVVQVDMPVAEVPVAEVPVAMTAAEIAASLEKF